MFYLGQFKSKEGRKDKLFGSAVARWTKYNTLKRQSYKKVKGKDYVQNCSWLTGPWLLIQMSLLLVPLMASNRFCLLLCKGKTGPIPNKIAVAEGSQHLQHC